MPDISRIEIFIEVAKRESFAAAAKAMGLTGPAVSKQVMALEEELGVKLLHRTTRSVTMTDEGSLYFERASLAIEELKDAAADVQDLKSAPRGPLRIGVPLSFGQTHLLPVLSGFARKYPEIAMDVSFDDRAVDIIAEGYDVVVRIGVLRDSSLIVRPLGECPIYAVASPKYLAQHGTPETPKDLKQHRLIAYAHHGTHVEWKYRDAFGKTGLFKGEGSFRANTAEMMLQAALDGVGIAFLPGFSAASYLKAGKLIAVLPKYKSHPTRDIAALMPPNRYRATKVKLFVDWLSNACKAMPLSTE